jgi:hypothetical protein
VHLSPIFSKKIKKFTLSGGYYRLRVKVIFEAAEVFTDRLPVAPSRTINSHKQAQIDLPANFNKHLVVNP